MSNQTVFALYHADRTMPISVYATQELAFEALEFWAADLAKNTAQEQLRRRVFALAEARREFSVVRLNVFDKV